MDDAQSNLTHFVSRDGTIKRIGRLEHLVGSIQPYFRVWLPSRRPVKSTGTVNKRKSLFEYICKDSAKVKVIIGSAAITGGNPLWSWRLWRSVNVRQHHFGRI